MILQIILFLLAIVLCYYYLYKPHQYWKEQGVLHIKPWPIFGNSLDFVFTRISFRDWTWKFYNTFDSRYYGIYQFLQPILVIKDADLVKQMAIKDFNHFVDHSSFFSESDEPVFKHNLFSLNGSRWRKMRATVSPTFTSQKLKSMFIQIVDCAHETTKYLINNATRGKTNVLEMNDLYCRFSNDVIATCACGINCNSQQDKNNEFYLNTKNISNFGGIRGIKFLGFNYFPHLMRLFKIRLFSNDLVNFIRHILTSKMAIRERHNIQRPDMINLLIEAREEKLKYEIGAADNEDTGFAVIAESSIGTVDMLNKAIFTNDEMAAQVLVFFLAGIKTSATTLSFMSYEMALNEDIQRKLQEEIDKTMDACDGKITYEIVVRLKYLDMVISECLRKWNPVFFINRLCVKPYTIEPKLPGEKPVHLKVNDTIWFPNDSFHKDPKIYPNPEKFIPERFSDENRHKINKATYIPFGIGPRSCIGTRFALLEIKALTVHLLWKFDIFVVKETNVPVKIAPKEFLLSATDGIKLGFKLREKQSL